MKRRKIVGIGACCYDTLYSLETYPQEDTKAHAAFSRIAGGGPVSTGLCAAAKLGIEAEYLGNLAGDEAGSFLKKDFEKWGVGTDNIHIVPGTSSFKSVLWLCANSGSRTCVFDRGNVSSSRLTPAQKKAIREADVLMVDGNMLDMAIEGAEIARESSTKVLYDCGGLYEGIEPLLKLTDIMIPSEEFALGITKTDNAAEAAAILFQRYSPAIIVVTQGSRGGLLFDGENTITYPVYPTVVIDSNGSGDVFHGAFAAGYVYGFSYEKCCHFASAVSAMKCAGIGARESTPDYETVIRYLKENHYEL